jgi:DNA-binding transcriptional regulator LsrR (DeoR family)
MAETITTLDYDRMRQLNEVLTLYYVGEFTQAEVGRQLGLSTTKVNRLLQYAREQGMVEISIRTPFQYLFELEAKLKEGFGLTDAVVIPQIPDDPAAMVHTLGRAGAGYLLDRLRDGDVLTVGGGTAVHAVAQALRPQKTVDVRVAPCMGAVQGRVTTDVNYLAAQLAAHLGGAAYQLHAPAFVDTSAQRESLLSMGPIREILDIARDASVALLGVGTVDAQTSRFVQFTALSPGDMNRIADTCEGVGEIAARVYDREGRPRAEEYARRTVGLTLHELQQIPLTIGVAATPAKSLPIYGALRGGHLDALITDESAARGVLRLLEHGP